MRTPYAVLAALLIATTGACATGGHRYHDEWSDQEVVYYGQWERDTHRDHREFRDRNADEQKAYWDWRHDHDDHH